MPCMFQLLKSNPMLLCCLLINPVLFSQEKTESYAELFNTARILNTNKDYFKAAQTYAAAIRLAGPAATNSNRWSLSCYWMDAGKPDSAFTELSNIAERKDITFSYLEELLTDDDCFLSLHTDQRWTVVKEKMFLRALLNYKTAVKAALGAEPFITGDDKTLALALGNNADSAYQVLNRPVYQLLLKKDFEKARRYAKANETFFNDNYWMNESLGDCYKAMKDPERAFVYYARALLYKYRKLLLNPGQLPNPDSVLMLDYQRLSQKTGRKAVPPPYLLSVSVSRYLQKGHTEIAGRLANICLANHPNNYLSHRSMGDYHRKLGDQQQADKYYKKSMQLDHNLPDSFFDEKFPAARFLKQQYENISRQRSGLVLPPLQTVNNLANLFINNKQYEQAGDLLVLNVTNYPKNPVVYNNLAAFYKTTGDSIRAASFQQKFQELRKNPPPQPLVQREVRPDTTYDVSVANKACQSNCPVIWFDEAHNNYHTASNRYKPLANLLNNDGYKIIKGETPLTAETLKNVQVAIIAAPGPIPVEEIKILVTWIKQGGALLTVTDHSNFGFDGLLEALGVGTPETEYTEDPENARILEDGITKNPRHIVFSSRTNTLGDHPIIRGQNKSETIHTVKTFSGRTVIAPPGSSVLLRLSKSAVDYITIEPAIRTVEGSVAVTCKGQRVYGTAFTLGKGKVVVVSEAAMLTAQIWTDGTPGAGMNTPGSDNKQFALNIMRWLTGYLN